MYKEQGRSMGRDRGVGALPPPSVFMPQKVKAWMLKS